MRGVANTRSGANVSVRNSEAYDAMQTCLAWDTIYDPAMSALSVPVSRVWNVREGGWALFCWDTFFAAYMAAADSRELATPTRLRCCARKHHMALCPMSQWAWLQKGLDRSQPPVGSLVVRELLSACSRQVVLCNRYLMTCWRESLVVGKPLVDGLLARGSNP
jgi:hypothetical protein